MILSYSFNKNNSNNLTVNASQKMVCLQAKSPFTLPKSNSFSYSFTQIKTMKCYLINNKSHLVFFFSTHLNSYDMKVGYENTNNKGSNFRLRLSLAGVTKL